MSLRLRIPIGLLAVTSVLFWFRTTVYALPVVTLDFGVIAPTAGTIKYNVANGPLMGTGITVKNVIGLDSMGGTGGPPPGPPQPRTCFACTLNFTSGNIVQTTATSWVFSGGGSIVLTGRVDLNGDGIDNDYPVSVSLLSGSFTGDVSVFEIAGVLKIAGASFSDVKDRRLLGLYGLPTTAQYTGGFNISFNATGIPNPGTNLPTFTSSRVLSGDIVNSPISEPGSLLLLGSGLVGFVYLARRRRKGA